MTQEILDQSNGTTQCSNILHEFFVKHKLRDQYIYPKFPLASVKLQKQSQEEIELQDLQDICISVYLQTCLRTLDVFFSLLIDLCLQIPFPVAAINAFLSSWERRQTIQLFTKRSSEKPCKKVQYQSYKPRKKHLLFKLHMVHKDIDCSMAGGPMTGKSYSIAQVCHWKEIAENSYQRLCDS